MGDKGGAMVIALIGNPNSGKTTLFNQLTGSNQHVGNFPGVTVEKKEGRIRHQRDVSVVDLPGIYSLSPYTGEEVLTRDFLLNERPDVILNIVDATNIERNLYLTLQLMELQMPLVLALNMMDEMEKNGSAIDVLAMEQALNIPVVPIAASRNQGVAELIERVVHTGRRKPAPPNLDFCAGEVHKAIHAIAHLIEPQAAAQRIPSRFAATKLVEGDAPMQARLGLTAGEMHIIDHAVAAMEQALSTDREAALADMRFAYIQTLVQRAVHKSADAGGHMRSVRIDTLMTHRFLAIPLFLAIMMAVFYLTFGPVGAGLSERFGALIDHGIAAVGLLLSSLGINALLTSLVMDGVMVGVGSVLSFLPTILLLFFFLSLLEDSGYMARVAFVMDKLLRKIGLSGRSFVPMLIGFGCSVPAIMATRTLASERDRKMTILLTPFMSCSAKLPIYALFTAAFFTEHRALVMMGLYLLGIAAGIAYGLVCKSTLFRGNPVPFVMELPNYRFPAPKSVLLHMGEKAADFIKRAFTIILISTVMIWTLQTFDFRFNVVSDSANSMLAGLGRLIAPLFAPLGFGDWRASTALVTGLTAKEAVVSTFAVLMGVSGDTALAASMGQLFTPLSALSFLSFTALYMPCVAAMAAVRRELHSFWMALLAMGAQTAWAWVVTFVLYRVALLFAL
jgi:ferrous iron transport protein B